SGRPSARKRSCARAMRGNAPAASRSARRSSRSGGDGPLDPFESMNNDAYEAVIGLEVHAHMLTRSKLFCGCAADFGAPPNHNVCPVCMAMPGVLPVLNRHVL